MRIYLPVKMSKINATIFYPCPELRRSDGGGLLLKIPHMDVYAP